MKKLIILFLIIAPVIAFSQSLDRQVIGSAGDYSTATGISLSFTVGEAVIETTTSGSIILTQGFQQPDAEPVGIEIPEVGLSINAFPNPTGNMVVIEMESTENLKVLVQLLDVVGQQLMNPINHTAADGKTFLEIDLSRFAAGNYFLKLSGENNTWIKTIQVQKIN